MTLQSRKHIDQYHFNNEKQCTINIIRQKQYQMMETQINTSSIIIFSINFDLELIKFNIVNRYCTY